MVFSSQSNSEKVDSGCSQNIQLRHSGDVEKSGSDERQLDVVNLSKSTKTKMMTAPDPNEYV